MKGKVVFLQRRAHRAGAQTCLLRLLRQPLIRALDPLLVAGEAGWLTQACAAEGIACLVEPFPSSRSLSARLYRNRAFAARVRERVGAAALVHGNDHLESLLALELARALGVPSALFLRSPTMTADDFIKYRCAEHAFVAAVGEELQACGRAAGAPAVALIHDGLEPGEFLPPKPPPARFPGRILVIGSNLEWKGWGDALQALDGFPANLAFTGKGENRAGFEYLGRVENFRELARGFDLALNPSWHESFGMAALEVLAAGVPLFSTRSGVIEQVIADKRWLARPRDPVEMRRKLDALAAGWPGTALDVAACQAAIHSRFMVEQAAQKLRAAYKPLLGR